MSIQYHVDLLRVHVMYVLIDRDRQQCLDLERREESLDSLGEPVGESRKSSISFEFALALRRRGPLGLGLDLHVRYCDAVTMVARSLSIHVHNLDLRGLADSLPSRPEQTSNLVSNSSVGPGLRRATDPQALCTCTRE